MRTPALAALAFFCLSIEVARAQVPPRPTPSPEQPSPGDAPPADAPPAAEPPGGVPPPEEPPAVTAGSSFESISVMGGSASVREHSQDSLLLPRGGLEVGGEMTFLTSGVGMVGGEPLAFTDVGLLSLNNRYSFGPVEMAAAIQFLVKQPSYTDEFVPQAGSLTSRVALGDGQALSLRLSTGPLLAGRGLWEGAELGVEAKRVVHETLVFKGLLGGSLTHLELAEDTAQSFWFSEVVVAAETVLRTPVRAFAVWLGAELRFPMAYNPDAEDPAPTGYLDPHTRLNFYVGGAYSYVDQWDLFAQFAFIDRVDEGDPATMVPILDGGFDQQQTTLGVIYRWDLADD